LDELGAGTDPTEGAALAISILEYLLEKGARTVATTHYSELKAFAYKWERVENASVEFNIETLQPTYRLLLGLPGKSNAFEIASRLGLKKSIVDMARGYLSDEELQVGDLIQDLKEAQLKSEEDRREAEKLRLMQERRGDELQTRQEAWREKETRLLKRAQEEAMEIVQQAKSEAEQLVRKLRQLQKETVNRETMREAQEARESLRDSYSKIYDAWTQVSDQVEERHQPTEEEEGVIKGDEGKGPAKGKEFRSTKEYWRKTGLKFKPGDQVLISRLNQRGYVLSPPTADGEVQVQAGIMKIRVRMADLRPVAEKKETEYKSESVSYQGVGNLMFSKSREVSNEIHLRGMLVDEALTELEKYLDDACLAGIAEVRVVHGKGTGTLRTAVQQYLSGHPQVKSYRLGGYREGGIGVTVVQLSN
jgi:DNA mismatch repair protein MutS2